MKLSTKGKYGVRALFEVARNFGKGPLAIKEIAERQKISLSYLEQILHKLGKAGIIASVRGPHGGYELARRPADLTIGDVVRLIESNPPEGRQVTVRISADHLEINLDEGGGGTLPEKVSVGLSVALRF